VPLIKNDRAEDGKQIAWGKKEVAKKGKGIEPSLVQLVLRFAFLAR
jgi:hypothetical protein